jgi:ATP-dependent 26S proteasome regulatory subunit
MLSTSIIFLPRGALIASWARLILCNLSQACFLKLAGPQLVQMFIGDGAKLVRDAFALAKEKSKPGF